MSAGRRGNLKVGKRRSKDAGLLVNKRMFVRATARYESEGYFPIPAFLGYVGIPSSRCYAK